MEIYKPKTLDEAKILLFNNENSKILENTEEGIYKGLKEIIQKPYRNKEFSSNYNNLNRLKDIIDFIGE